MLTFFGRFCVRSRRRFDAIFGVVLSIFAVGRRRNSRPRPLAPPRPPPIQINSILGKYIKRIYGSQSQWNLDQVLRFDVVV